MNVNKGLIRHWAMLFESGYGLSEEEAEMHEAKKTEYVDGEGNRYSFRGDDDDEEQMRRDSNVKNQMQTVDDRVELLRQVEKFPDLLQDAALLVLRTICADRKDREKVFGILEKWGNLDGAAPSLRKSHEKSDFEHVAKSLKGYLARIEGSVPLSYRYGDDVYESN